MGLENNGLNSKGKNSKGKEHPYVIDLINRTKEGDDQAFAEILHLYSNRILYVVKRYVSEPSDISDVCQEVYIRLFRYMKTFKGDSSFYTWLYSVISSVSKNYLATKSRTNHLNVNDDYNFTDYMEFAIDIHENVNPQDILVSDETLDLLTRTIDKLPDMLREVIILREIEGLPYETIAGSLKISVGTVRSRIFRARSIIEDRLNYDGRILMLHHKI